MPLIPPKWSIEAVRRCTPTRVVTYGEELCGVWTVVRLHADSPSAVVRALKGSTSQCSHLDYGREKDA